MIVQAINALHGVDSYWKEVVSESTWKNDIKLNIFMIAATNNKML